MGWERFPVKPGMTSDGLEWRPGVIGSLKCSDFGNFECSVFGSNTTVDSVTMVQPPNRSDATSVA